MVKYNNNIFNEKRRVLIESLRRRENMSESVLQAMSILPREKFVSSPFLNRAYEDTALPIDCNQSISQPYTVAYMTTLLNVKEDDKILEIGTGSGYQACLLALMGARVYSIERITELYEIVKKRFDELGFKINMRLGDGTIGWKEHAPYQGIIITAAAPDIPGSLLKQLAIGGRMVVPVGDRAVQSMYLIRKLSDDNYEKTLTDSFKFVPLVGKEGWKSE
jgi:protein-L-isoaspartate(D-aspartate) O-methyltransferase